VTAQVMLLSLSSQRAGLSALLTPCLPLFCWLHFSLKRTAPIGFIGASRAYGLVSAVLARNGALWTAISSVH
jgi:hypothetical protein